MVLLEKSSIRQSDSWHRAARVLIRSPDGTQSRPRALLQRVHTWVKLHSHCRSLEMIKSWFILSDNRRRNLVGTLDRCRCLVEIIWYCEGFTDPVWSLLNWSQARVEPQYRKSACVVFSASTHTGSGVNYLRCRVPLLLYSDVYSHQCSEAMCLRYFFFLYISMHIFWMKFSACVKRPDDYISSRYATTIRGGYQEQLTELLSCSKRW